MDDWNASARVPAVEPPGTSDYTRPVTAPVDKARPFMDDNARSISEVHAAEEVGERHPLAGHFVLRLLDLLAAFPCRDLRFLLAWVLLREQLVDAARDLVGRLRRDRVDDLSRDAETSRHTLRLVDHGV